MIRRSSTPAAVFLTLLSAWVAPADAAAPASGAHDIVASIGAGAWVVTGKAGAPRKLDARGYIADIRVDRVLAGNVKMGAVIPVVWEELSPSRAVRIEEGMSYLLCLAPLSTHSIWRKRLPTPAERSGVRMITGRGDSFVRSPNGPTLYALQHYTAMHPEARVGAPGLAYIVDLVAVAPAGLAAEALALLAGEDDLATALAPGSARVLVRTAGDASRPEQLRMAVVRLAGDTGLSVAREDLVKLSAGGAPVDAGALLALSKIDDGLPPERVEELLASERADLRVVGVRTVAGDGAREKLGEAVDDDAAAVRVAAVEELVRRFGMDAAPLFLPALGDSDNRARTAMAVEVGGLGDDIVEPLVEIVNGENERAAEAAVVALSVSGRAGRRALERISRDHPDERMRKVAALALGEFPGHKH